MYIIVSYDITDNKQLEFKTYLKEEKEWSDQLNEKSLPETTLIKKCGEHRDEEVERAIKDLQEAANIIKTTINKALISFTDHKIEIINKNIFTTNRFRNLIPK